MFCLVLRYATDTRFIVKENQSFSSSLYSASHAFYFDSRYTGWSVKLLLNILCALSTVGSNLSLFRDP